MLWLELVEAIQEFLLALAVLRAEGFSHPGIPENKRHTMFQTNGHAHDVSGSFDGAGKFLEDSNMPTLFYLYMKPERPIMFLVQFVTYPHTTQIKLDV